MAIDLSNTGVADEGLISSGTIHPDLQEEGNYPWSMHMFHRHNDAGGERDIMGMYDASESARWFRVHKQGGHMVFQWRDGSIETMTTAISDTVTSWYSSGYSMDASKNAAFYWRNTEDLEGSLVTDTQTFTLTPPPGIDTFGVGATANSSPISSLNGQMCEFAVWNVELTQEEFRALAYGWSPFHIRPGNLLHYFPMLSDDDRADRVGGLTLVNQSSTISADYPHGQSIIYPQNPALISDRFGAVESEEIILPGRSFSPFARAGGFQPFYRGDAAA